MMATSVQGVQGVLDAVEKLIGDRHRAADLWTRGDGGPAYLIGDQWAVVMVGSEDTGTVAILGVSYATATGRLFVPWHEVVAIKQAAP
jgi:hypothetical protein